MNNQEYAEYQETVKNFFEREGINNLSSTAVCGNCDKNHFKDPNEPCEHCGSENINCEPFFSWLSCDCCNSGLGGDKYNCTGYHPETGKIFTYSICADCLHYTEYGQLDDMTMMEIDPK